MAGQKFSVNKKFIASGYEVSTALPNHVFLNFVNVTGYSSMKPKKLNWISVSGYFQEIH